MGVTRAMVMKETSVDLAEDAGKLKTVGTSGFVGETLYNNINT